jgi:putative FmdB family regulatory protein
VAKAYRGALRIRAPSRAGYDHAVPIYEFVCDACGERFEELVAAGTDRADCRACGAPGAPRVFSAQAAMPRLVKTPRDARRQEGKNADLQARSKKQFGKAVRSMRPKPPASGGGGG